MKKQLLTIALLAGALTASAGVNLVVSGQQQQSFAVGDIGKITFTESTMDVYGKDSSKDRHVQPIGHHEVVFQRQRGKCDRDQSRRRAEIRENRQYTQG